MTPEVQRLQDIEEIRQLRARYTRYSDTHDWDNWRRLFVDDFVLEVEGLPRVSRDLPDHGRAQGIDAIVKASAELLDGVPTAHHVLLPEIIITGPDTATGVWAVNDEIWFPTCHFKGWGHYHEKYLRTDDGWRIASTQVTRNRVEEHWL